ncbi:MAG: FGGY family carbohydrate kinase [Pseudomonadota bacterium]
MVAPVILAIDQGTSATKCLALNEAGAVIAKGQAPLGESRPRPGWVEQDADALWQSVVAAVRACLAERDGADVVAIGIANQRESMLLWDGDTGRPLSPVISWQDQRTVDLCDKLRSPDAEDLVQARSGLPLDPMFSALKARWLLDTYDPDRTRSRAGRIRLGTIDSWLLHRASGGQDGAHVIEVGNASRTQLLNIAEADWDDSLLGFFDVPANALPRIVPSVGPFPSVRGLAPVPDGTPIAAVMGDSHAALFAHGAFEAGPVKATYGTGSSVMGLVEKPDAVADGLCLTIAWSIDHPAYAAEANIRSAGATLRWTADLLGITTDDLVALAEGADSQGVSLVPAFNGMGAPWWDQRANGTLCGLTLGAGRPQVARAALESIPHQVADVIDAFDRSIGRVSVLHADGGPTRNDALMQLQADLLDRPVHCTDAAELSALGVAHLAGLSVGLWTLESLKTFDRGGRVFQPAMPAFDRATHRARWLTAIQQVLNEPATPAPAPTLDIPTTARCVR